jgi:hypothetical protein
MNALVTICLLIVLTVIDLYVWWCTVSAIRRRAVEIGADSAEDIVRLREDPWCRAYVTIGMVSNCGLLALIYFVKRSMMA